MSKRSIRIRRESTALFRRLALLLPVGFTWLRFSTCTFYSIWRSGIERKHCGRFRLFLSILLGGWFSGLSPLRCMSCLSLLCMALAWWFTYIRSLRV